MSVACPCDKEPFPSATAAHKALRALCTRPSTRRKTQGLRLEAYRCPVVGSVWHLGRSRRRTL
jgi:hypothetical protein